MSAAGHEENSPVRSAGLRWFGMTRPARGRSMNLCNDGSEEDIFSIVPDGTESSFKKRCPSTPYWATSLVPPGPKKRVFNHFGMDRESDHACSRCKMVGNIDPGNCRIDRWRFDCTALVETHGREAVPPGRASDVNRWSNRGPGRWQDGAPSGLTSPISTGTIARTAPSSWSEKCKTLNGSLIRLCNC